MKKSLFLILGFIVATASGSWAQSQKRFDMTPLHPVKIETVSVLPEGVVALDAGLAYEMDRKRDVLEIISTEYDNLRLAPVGIRYGVAPSLEIGAHIKYSSNDGADRYAPDESGLEGIAVFGKMELNPYLALQVGLNLAGSDDVYPYPSDGLDIYGNLALQRSMGRGLLYGEFGYTAQGGDLDFNKYVNYGIGYALPATETISLNIELIGEERHIGTLGNTLDLLLGGNLLIADNMRVAPYLLFGINDAGPDFAIGVTLEALFGVGTGDAS